MEAYNYQWSNQDACYNQQYNNTPNDYHPSWQNHPTYPWSYNNQDHFYDPSYAYPPQQPLVQKFNLEEILDRFLEQTEMTTSYSSEIAYEQPPLQQEGKSNLEEVLAKFMAATEERLTNQDKLLSQLVTEIESQEASLRNLEIQMEQLVNAVINCPQDTLPSDTEIDPKEECEVQYKADTSRSGKELYKVVGGNLKRSHPSVEEDYEVVNKRSIIDEEEEKDEDDQALSLNDVKLNLMVPPVPFTKQVQILEEYYQVYVIEGKLNDLDEFKFGGGLQSSKHAKEIKEKTKRRHEKINFAIEPD